MHRRPRLISLKNLFLINLVLLEHSVIMLEDSQFVMTSQVLLVSTAIIWILAKRKLSLALLFIFLFVISVAWKWVLLVKRAQSKKMATLFFLEPACLAQQTGSSWISSIVDYVWPKKVSSCEAYFEAMHVESIWQVSPLDALIDTLSDVCFRPLAGLGTGISAYFNAVIGTTPIWWTPVVLVLSFGLLIVLIMCLMRYRFSSPFFSIEPHTSNTLSAKTNLRQHQQDERPTQLKQLAQLKRIAHQPERRQLPYPIGPNLLDKLVPQSFSYQQKPEYQ